MLGYEIDLESQPQIAQQAAGDALQVWDLAGPWRLSPPAWMQFALLIAAYLLAVLVVRRLRPALTRLLTPPAEHSNVFATASRFVLIFVPLVLPLLAYVFTGIGETVVRSLFDSSSVIAFGKCFFLFLAARILVREIIDEPFLKLMGRFVLLPVAAIYTVGLLDVVGLKLTETTAGMDNIRFSLMALARGAIAGSLLVWLVCWSNDQSCVFIGKQKEMRPATRELAIKAVEIALYGIAFILLMNIMGANLSTLAVLGGGIGAGLGFGLQKIASNFISGVILLLKRQATVGDYVERDGGEAGTIVKMSARVAILKTFDGRWMVVPNEDFITTRVVNSSDSGSAKRHEAPFSVSNGTDINTVPAITAARVARPPFVPDGPDRELRGVGDRDIAIECRVNGIDDGRNKFTPRVLFAAWNALRGNGIEIPCPHPAVALKSGPLGSAA
ncbi:mechanosensitive ion channel family protein [Sedimentitalea sp. HM32M-2]|uniref:mechanosensitive ion channel family protein n=1 Tax=Sedimentitalea sp. HM32M-2 TaxID=3351566 RepID=UPI003630B250